MRVKAAYCTFDSHFIIQYSTLCRVNIGVKCSQAGIVRDRSGVLENTVPFGIRKVQTGIFGRMERALCFPKSRINENGGKFSAPSNVSRAFVNAFF